MRLNRVRLTFSQWRLTSLQRKPPLTAFYIHFAVDLTMTLPLSPPFTTTSAHLAAAWIRSGRLLAYPTESVWGIGCDPFNQEAVQQLLDIKARPIEKGMIVVTDCAARIAPLLSTLSTVQRQRVLASWQHNVQKDDLQAHTWLLPLPQPSAQTHTIPAWITGIHHSVAVRVIAHPLVQQLCAELVSDRNPYGLLVSTSCNPSSQPPAQSLVDAQAYFTTSDADRSSVSNVLDTSVGYLVGDTLAYQMPSQIRDALTGQIIR